MIKQGSGNFASNSGLEPYSEQYCSEILDVLGYNHVNYIAEMFHDKLASSCKLLTTKQTMMIPMSACLENYDWLSIQKYCMNNNMLEDLYQMVIFDYLVTNDDRHLNNVGVLLDADDFTVKGLAPIFDNGAGLLAYAVKDNLKNYTAACEYASGKGPCFYDNF